MMAVASALCNYTNFAHESELRLAAIAVDGDQCDVGHGEDKRLQKI